MDIRVSLPVFEGPLNLLLHLIKQNKVDIYDIPIALITKQYLEYLEVIKEFDEVASEFLVMAATLIYIKSKMLLPQRQSEVMQEDPRQQLVNQLIEYQKFKEASQYLKEKYQIWSQAFPRKNKSEEDFLIDELSIYDLITALKRVLQKPEPKIYLPKETIKVEDKIKELIKIIKEKGTIIFDEIFKENTSKMEIIVTFIALLELIKIRVAKAFQERPFGKILITILEEKDVSRSYL
ncbi:MAG: segregation/condensation protein A [Thermodesulfovibrio sp.]|nr:segregation/condensation protein A [Thermodesulfovibrio sp.]